jgi:hypothetical protein
MAFKIVVKREVYPLVIKYYQGQCYHINKYILSEANPNSTV